MVSRPKRTVNAGRRGQHPAPPPTEATAESELPAGSRVLLENRTEDASECGDCEVGANGAEVAGSVNSMHQETDKTKSVCSWCQSDNEASGLVRLCVYRSKAGPHRGQVEILTESLILAQDERWRRA